LLPLPLPLLLGRSSPFSLPLAAEEVAEG